LRKYTLLIFIFILVSSGGHAQVVTASFNKFTMATNPSASATRDHSFFSISANRENSLAKIKQEIPGTTPSQLREELVINKKEFILAGVGKRFSSEFYLSFDDLQKTLQLYFLI
jgi:hypothetical protein